MKVFRQKCNIYVFFLGIVINGYTLDPYTPFRILYKPDAKENT